MPVLNEIKEDLYKRIYRIVKSGTIMFGIMFVLTTISSFLGTEECYPLLFGGIFVVCLLIFTLLKKIKKTKKNY